MGHDFLIGCVGKPSSGKSTFFNAVAYTPNAKVGAYPFTTIEPNQGVSYYTTDCPCARLKVQCKPHYGYCEKGKRKVPIKLIDVAGLIPGASTGYGLGNKFLDDLRQADILLHIIDISGSTNEKGEETTGYDCSEDHEWLVHEIELWIFNNLWSKWSSIARRHNATKSSILMTLVGQLSGYGAKESSIVNVISDLSLKNPINLLEWTEDSVMLLAKTFVAHRFKFILMLNKADLGQIGSANALKMAKRYPSEQLVMCSAYSECFLKKMKSQKYIQYESGASSFITESSDDSVAKTLKPLDASLQQKLDRVKNVVLFRFGSTGVFEGINRAVAMAGLVPVYPVKNLTTFGSEKSGKALPECILVPPGTTVGSFARSFLHLEMSKPSVIAEGEDGRRMGENEVFRKNVNTIVRYVSIGST